MTTAPPEPVNADPVNVAADLEALLVPVADLDRLPGNPRRGDVDAVARSYATFGQRKPIVVRRMPDGRGQVVAGNHQLDAAHQLGWDRIAVVWTDDDDATAEAFALADNRTAELGDYDNELLLAMVDRVGEADAELLAAAAFGPDDVESLRRLVAAGRPRAALTDPDAVPDPPAVPVTQVGDVWVLGPHRLICGDSTDPEVVDRLMAGGQADMVWTDPPYGVNYTGGQGSQTHRRELSGDSESDAPDLYSAALACIAKVTVPTAAVYLWFAGSRGRLAYEAVDASGYEVRALLVWNKLNPHYGAFMAQYMQRHEPFLYVVRPGSPPRWEGPTNEVSVWDVAQPAKNEWHPTQKPVELAARAIRNSSLSADVVLDLFAGSGSTLIACHQEGRVARLVELDPGYCDVICRRYQEHTGGTAVREGDNARS